MRHYLVTYTEADATYPATPKTVEIEASTREIWEKAIALGTVQKIYEIGSGNVFSIHWDHNYLGLTDAQVRKNLEF